MVDKTLDIISEKIIRSLIKQHVIEKGIYYKDNNKEKENIICLVFKRGNNLSKFHTIVEVDKYLFTNNLEYIKETYDIFYVDLENLEELLSNIKNKTNYYHCIK